MDLNAQRDELRSLSEEERTACTPHERCTRPNERWIRQDRRFPGRASLSTSAAHASSQSRAASEAHVRH